jgi:hypothetical protein
LESQISCDVVRRHVEHYLPLGSRSDSSGNLFVGERLPGIPGEDAWFFIVYAPLTEYQLAAFNVDFGANLWAPAEVVKAAYGQMKTDGLELGTDYHRFLLNSNGARLFGGHLNLFGLRLADPWKTAQPLEISSANAGASGVARNNESGDFFFGGYRWDGSILLFSRSSGVIRRYSNNRVILNRWPSFSSFISAEFSRMSALFDASGNLKDYSVSTAPSEEPGVRSVIERNLGSGL